MKPAVALATGLAGLTMLAAAQPLDARLTERGAMPTPEVPAGSEGMFRRGSAAAVRTPASPPRSVSRPPLLAGERRWHAGWRNKTNRNLWRIYRCETGYLEGGRINWRHSNSVYAGGGGFAHSTWTQFRLYVRPLPPRYAHQARPSEQYAVGRALVRRYRGFSSWPACSIRLGLR